MKLSVFFVVLLAGSATCWSQGSTSAGAASKLSNQRALVQSVREEGKDSSRIAHELIKLGNLYNYYELHTEALGEFRRAATFLNEDSPDSLSVHLTLGLSEVQMALGEYQLAAKQLEEAFESNKSALGLAVLARLYGLWGICSEKNGNYLQALESQKKSLNLYTLDHNLAGIAQTEENIGSIYEDLGQFDLAFKHFESAFTLYKDTPTKEAAHLLNNLGDVRRKQGRYHEAIMLTTNSLDLAEQLQDYHQMQSANKDLSKNFSATGDFEKAYKHLVESNEYETHIVDERNTAQLNALKVQFENDLNTSEIQSLKESSTILKFERRLLGVALVLMIFSGLTASWYFFKKRKSDLMLQGLSIQSAKGESDKQKRRVSALEQELELKTSALTRFSLMLSHKNKILSDLTKTLDQLAARDQIDHRGRLKTIVQDLEQSIGEDAGWDTFMNIYEEIHPEFIKKLNDAADESLSPSELRLGMLLRMNLSSKEIASILRVTPDSVRVARHRLRKKLPIEHKKELVNFMVSL